jgi:hypothetical protein
MVNKIYNIGTNKVTLFIASCTPSDLWKNGSVIIPNLVLIMILDRFTSDYKFGSVITSERCTSDAQFFSVIISELLTCGSKFGSVIISERLTGTLCHVVLHYLLHITFIKYYNHQD